MSNDTSVLIAVLGPVSVLAGTYISSRLGKKGEREIALVKQYETTVEEMDKDIARLKREARLQSDYINSLRLDCVAHGFQPAEYPAPLRDLQEGKE